MNRKYYLGNIRWATVLLVMLYHVVYFFNNKGVFGGIGGFIDYPKGQPQDVLMYLAYPWFMMLLFVVAGMSSRYALASGKMLKNLTNNNKQLSIWKKSSR